MASGTHTRFINRQFTEEYTAETLKHMDLTVSFSHENYKAPWNRTFGMQVPRLYRRIRHIGLVMNALHIKSKSDYIWVVPLREHC